MVVLRSVGKETVSDLQAVILRSCGQMHMGRNWNGDVEKMDD
jgi:hypothetical protein